MGFGECKKPLSWTKHSEIYHRDSTKEWTGKRMPEAYIVQTLEKDQEKENTMAKQGSLWIVPSTDSWNSHPTSGCRKTKNSHW